MNAVNGVSDVTTRHDPSRPVTTRHARSVQGDLLVPRAGGKGARAALRPRSRTPYTSQYGMASVRTEVPTTAGIELTWPR